MRRLLAVLSMLMALPLSSLSAADPPGAATREDLAKVIIQAFDEENYSSIVSLLMSPDDASKSKLVDPVLYEAQRQEMLEIAKAYRQLLADRQQLPLKGTVALDPDIHFLMPVISGKFADGQEWARTDGTVTASRFFRQINLFGEAKKYKGRWYLTRLESDGDTPQINKLRGILGSRLPIRYDRKTYPLPEGYVIPDNETVRPGMPVQYFDERSRKFKAAELLSCSGQGAWVLYLPGENEQAGKTLKVMAPFVIASMENLQLGAKNPNAFTPSVRLLNPDSEFVLPDNLERIIPYMPLVPGTPIKVAENIRGEHSWVTRIVVAPFKDRDIHIMGPGFQSGFTTVNCKQCAIEKSVLEQLQQPGAAQKYEPQYIEALEEGAVKLIEDSLKTFPINLPYPDGYALLRENKRVARGTRLLVQDYQAWKTGTVMIDSVRGPLVLAWDSDQNFNPVAIARSSLLIKEGDDAQPGAETFEVVLLKSGDSEVRVAKVISETIGVDLKVALDILRETPISLQKGLSADEAKNFKRLIEAAGGEAKVQPSKAME